MMLCLCCVEQKKEEGGKFHPLQRFGSDLATEGKLGYEHIIKEPQHLPQ